MTKPPRPGNPAKSRNAPRAKENQGGAVPQQNQEKPSKRSAPELRPSWLSSIKVAINKRRDQIEARKKQRHAEDPNFEVARATYIIAAFTFATVIVAGIQGKFLFDANEATKAIQRAFVYPDTYLAAADPIGTLAVQVKWANSGNTPTRDLINFAKTQVLDEPMTNNFKFTETDETGNPYPQDKYVTYFIGPHASQGSQFVRVPGNALQDFKDKKPIYFWGLVRYYDVFGSTHHVTRFCQQIVGFGTPKASSQPVDANVPTQAVSVPAQFNACPIGNCADDECRRQGVP
jgi:hypothetical protein